MKKTHKKLTPEEIELARKLEAEEASKKKALAESEPLTPRDKDKGVKIKLFEVKL